MGSWVFTWGPFEVALGAGPIQHFIYFPLDKGKMEKCLAPFLQSSRSANLVVYIAGASIKWGIAIKWPGWCCYWQTASVPRHDWTLLCPPPYMRYYMKKCCNRALKSFFSFIFPKLFIIRPISSFCKKKPWNVKKFCCRSNLGTLHIKAPNLRKRDLTRPWWRCFEWANLNEKLSMSSPDDN